MVRRITAIGLTVLFVPLAALADDIGAGDDIVIEQKKPAPAPARPAPPPPPPMAEKAVSLPPPGWKPPVQVDDDAGK